MNEPKTETEEVNESVVTSLQSAGLGKKWANPKLSLSTMGDTGKKMAEDFPETINLVNKGWGVWIIGEGKAPYDLQMMVCRGLTLRGVGVRVTNLPYMLSVYKGELEDYGSVFQAQVIGIRGFFDSTWEKPFSSYDGYLLDMMLRQLIEDGKAFCIQTSVEPSKCNWWSPTLIQTIEESSAKYLYEQQGRNK